MEEEHNMRVRGFREVIDLISTSEKPVVAHNSINGLYLFVLMFLAFQPPQRAKISSFIISPIVLISCRICIYPFKVLSSTAFNN